MVRLLEALAFSADKHRGQTRKDEDRTPYIYHPIALTRVLAVEAGVTDIETLMAALLHDTIEDTDATEAELRARFGNSVAAVVMEVTDDTSLRKAERKQKQVERAPHLSQRARLVKLADKTCNLRDVANNPPAGWPTERRREYFDWAREVIDGLRGTHAGLEAIFDAAYALRP
ncbi:MAG: bifunctional (p)ppGpp synthetase/guanosine-3',5'-bis(diphosphate) 3'-pyrophosphohydrolase [Burkholderiales bacterium]|nr:MAG: bifunctional (p)ppGpp synthetase/guanosine-3',5'-bis(diphosphate) 3'-pyrophosphohydrolase [Burkholderiales bacterium]